MFALSLFRLFREMSKIGPLTMLSPVSVTAHTQGDRMVKYSECCEFGAAGGDAKQR